MAEEKGAYFSFTRTVQKPLRMLFADGEHAIPGFMVAQMGGAEEVQACAGALSQITFAEFARAFGDEQAGSYLQRFQAGILSEHFRGFNG